MNTLIDSLAHIQNFLQLNFVFTGLEVSSSAILAARLSVLIALGFGSIWAMVRIIMKLLDCVQTFLGNSGPLPRTLFLLLLLALPLSQESLGAKWIGYILLISAILGVAVLGVLVTVLWKYGVDQALRLIRNLRSTGSRYEGDPAKNPSGTSDPDGNQITGRPAFGSEI
jgi:hypothetical protein